MADGSIIIDLKIKNKETMKNLKQDFSNVSKEINKTEKSIKTQEKQLEITSHKLVEVEKKYKKLTDTTKAYRRQNELIGKSFTTAPFTDKKFVEEENAKRLKNNEEYQKTLSLQKEAKVEYENILSQLEKQEEELNKTNELYSKQKASRLEIEKSMQNEVANQNLNNEKLKEQNKTLNKNKISVKDFNKSITQSIKKFARLAITLVGASSVIRLLSSSINEWLQGSSDKARQLQADIKFLKYATADMLAPAIESVVNMFYKMLNIVNSVLKAFTGVDYLAKSLAKYTKESKNNMQGTLASFDQLEVYQKKEEMPSFATDKNETSSFALNIKKFFGDFTSDMNFEPLANSFHNLVDSLKELGNVSWGILVDSYEHFLKPVATLVVNKLLPEFLDFLADCVKWLSDTLLIIKPYWIWFMDNVLTPLATWIINEAVPRFFDLLRAALGLLQPVLEVALIVLKDLIKYVLIPLGEFTGGIILWFLEAFTNLFKNLGDWISSNKEAVAIFVEMFLGFLAGIWIYNSSKMIIPFIQNFYGELSQFLTTVKKFGLLNTIKLYLDSFTSSMNLAKISASLAAGAFGALAIGIFQIVQNWDKMSGFERIVSILAALAVAALAAATAVGAFQSAWSLGLAAAGIAAGILTISATVGAAQKRAEQQSAELSNSIPKLAKGGIAYQPTQAIIGEAGKEAVLPLERNTEWMDDLAEKINSRGLNIKFAGSLAQLGRVLRPVIEDDKSRVGTKLIKGGANV